MRATRLIPVLLLTAPMGCTQFPALDRATDPAALAAPYPALLPLEALPARATAPPADPAAVLTAEAAALKARAEALQAEAP